MDSKSDSKIAFFCHAKPQYCDAFDIFNKHNRVFIGHPLWRDGVGYDRNSLWSCLVDPLCTDDDEWGQEVSKQERTNEFTKNRNFVKKVTVGSIVVIPRSERGVAYLARITTEFELENSPPWASDYLKLRKKQNCLLEDNIHRHIGDVAQGWEVDKYEAIGWSIIPDWIRKVTSQRPTYDIIGSSDPSIAHSELSKVLEDLSI